LAQLQQVYLVEELLCFQHLRVVITSLSLVQVQVVELRFHLEMAVAEEVQEDFALQQVLV
jgi:hypothetical protein